MAQTLFVILRHMKQKIFFSGVVLLSLAAFFGCQQNTAPNQPVSKTSTATIVVKSELTEEDSMQKQATEQVPVMGDGTIVGTMETTRKNK